jgi:hypothetical protein
MTARPLIDDGPMRKQKKHRPVEPVWVIGGLAQQGSGLKVRAPEDEPTVLVKRLLLPIGSGDRTGAKASATAICSYPYSAR